MGGMDININFPGKNKETAPPEQNDIDMRERLQAIERMLTEQKPVEQTLDELRRGDAGRETNEELRRRTGRIAADQTITRLREGE